jgi:hypothetical protein
MRRVLISLFLLFTIILVPSFAEAGWYSINWQPGNEWLNNNSQTINWNSGLNNKYFAHFGVQWNEGATPPPGKTFDRNLTLVVTSEPQLDDEFRVTKIGDTNKYFRTYVTNQKVNQLEIDSTDPSKYINIYIDGYRSWNGNFRLNVKENRTIFPDDDGFNGIYTTYYRFRLYPTAHLFDDDYILLDDTLYFSLVYHESQQWIATALEVTPYVEYVDVIQLQQNNSELTVGSVEFLSDDAAWGSNYTLQITPGEVGSTQFAFHKNGGGSTIPYKVRIVNSTIPSSNSFLERVVTTRDMYNHWYDFIELAISGFTQNQVYDTGNYSSIIKITLTSN